MTMAQVPEVMAVPLKVNIMSNRKVMLTKDTPLSSHLAVYVEDNARKRSYTDADRIRTKKSMSPTHTLTYMFQAVRLRDFN